MKLNNGPTVINGCSILRKLNVIKPSSTIVLYNTLLDNILWPFELCSFVLQLNT